MDSFAMLSEHSVSVTPLSGGLSGDLPPTERIAVVSAESRIAIVAAESRIAVVAAEA